MAGFFENKNKEKWSLYDLERDKLFWRLSYTKKEPYHFGIVYYSGIIITSVYNNWLPEASGLANCHSVE